MTNFISKVSKLIYNNRSLITFFTIIFMIRYLKYNRHEITEILLKVALNTTTLTLNHNTKFYYFYFFNFSNDKRRKPQTCRKSLINFIT
jgi:hypothetical protein